MTEGRGEDIKEIKREITFPVTSDGSWARII
jgi:hypothetical protein